MTAAIPTGRDDGRYLPTSYTTHHEGTVAIYRAPCEVCGAECDWTLRPSAGTCPCTTDDVEAAA